MMYRILALVILWCVFVLLGWACAALAGKEEPKCPRGR